jgi:uncharacterized protein (DUF2062 family)
MLHRFVKDRDTIVKSRWVRPFAHLLAHPSLWHLNRRSVPRGLAIGLFAAFVLPLGQFLLAALLAIPVRGNVPVAAAATLVTNPLTVPPIYLAAYTVGRALLHHSSNAGGDGPATTAVAKFLQVSGPTAVGLLLFGLLAASVGYIAASAWWRMRLVSRWKNSREVAAARAHWR